MINYIKVFLAVCFWGASFSYTKKALTDVSPETLTALRCLLGTVTLLFFTKSFKWIEPLKNIRLLPKLIFISFLGIAGHKTLQAYAMINTSANHAGWLIGAIPLIVVFVMMMFFKEKIGKLRLLGFVLGFFGILIVAVSEQVDIKGALIPTGLGDILIIISCFSWAFYTILMKRWFADFKTFDITLVTMVIAFLMMSVVYLLKGNFTEISRISFDGWVSILYLGIFCSAIAFVLWNTGVEKLGPSKVSSFLYLEPFPAIITGFIVLGEKISPVAFFGGSIILAGVYWVNGGRRGAGILRKIYSWFEEG
jgi:drug/metabolite transporter (DMT)-like permease